MVSEDRNRQRRLTNDKIKGPGVPNQSKGKPKHVLNNVVFTRYNGTSVMTNEKTATAA